MTAVRSWGLTVRASPRAILRMVLGWAPAARAIVETASGLPVVEWHGLSSATADDLAMIAQAAAHYRARMQSYRALLRPQPAGPATS